MLVPLGFPPNGGIVHYSFYYLFYDSWRGILCILEKYTKKYKLKIKDLRIYHTGNSMEETIAKIAALYMITTFANPRVFDLSANKSYIRSLSNRTIRVARNKCDQVLVVAPGLFSCVQVEEQLRVPVEVYYTVHKIDSYYQTINPIKECDFHLDNSRSIFYPPNRGVILVNSEILGNVRYYTYTFLKCFSHQKIRTIGSCTKKSSTVSYKMDSTLVKVSNSLSFIYISRQFKDIKICKMYYLHHPYMMDFELSNGISILDFPIEGLTTINSLISVKSLIDTNSNNKNDALFKRAERLTIKCNMLSCKNNKLHAVMYKSSEKELSLSNNSNTKDVSKINNTIEDLDSIEQQENSLFDDVSSNLNNKKKQSAEISIIQDNNLSDKSLEPEADDGKDEYSKVQQTINTYNEDGFTLLHLAAQKGDVKEGRRLIQLKADIEITSKTKDGCDTALHFAAQKGHSSFVELLLCSGANVNKTSATGSGVTPLHEAAYYGHINVIRLLITYNATIDAKDRNGYSPLQYACSNGKLNSVQLLLKEGANLYLQNNNGETSLFDAVCFGYFEIVSVLISTAENKENYINTQNGYGKTVLHAVACKQAISKTHKNTIELLLKNGADPHLKDKLGQSPLHIAKKYNNEELILLFSPQSTKKSKLPIVAASILLTLVVSLGIAISIYLEILVVGVVIGVCSILFATAVFSHYHNSQSISINSSLETVINISPLRRENIYQTSL